MFVSTGILPCVGAAPGIHWRTAGNRCTEVLPARLSGHRPYIWVGECPTRGYDG